MFEEDENRPLIEGIDDLENYMGDDLIDTEDDELEEFFGAGLLAKVGSKLFSPKPPPTQAPIINVTSPAGPSAAQLAAQEQVAAETRAAAEKKDKRDNVMMYVGIVAAVATVIGLIWAITRK